ncbi:Zinc finger protein 606 [Araneus ventricosus]|uniref:Zinc finger protein 606 n=1 Tax=Araneus ventricosus TaxID=182803 RepID=A0A4Y2QAT0_ARAVE|nr:Zinc finger protein 606 [Araneus ventricosus]
MFNRTLLLSKRKKLSVYSLYQIFPNRFTSTSIEQNELQNSTCCNAVSSEEYREESADRNRNALFDDDTCVPESSIKFPVFISLCSTIIPGANGTSRNNGIVWGQNDKYSSEVVSHCCYNRDKELANRCEFVVSCPSGLKVKSQWHSENGQFICPVCEKDFRLRDNFLIHCRPHTGEKTFGCDSYDKIHFEKYLTHHLQIHRGEIPFACDECEITCAKKCQLTRHSWTHNGEKPYKCPICGKTFSYSSVRNRHHKTFHNRKT